MKNENQFAQQLFFTMMCDVIKTRDAVKLDNFIVSPGEFLRLSLSDRSLSDAMNAGRRSFSHQSLDAISMEKD